MSAFARCLVGLLALLGTIQAHARPASLDAGPELELSGRAMGTSWHVRLPAGVGRPAAQALAREIRMTLDAIEARMSTWRPHSELSLFNASRSNAWQPVSAQTARVVSEALHVYRRSAGAFDPTVAPLVDLWGFGSTGSRSAPPSAREIRAVSRRIGGHLLVARSSPPALRKLRPDVSVDLSGLAKGFAVDAVTLRLEQAGVGSFLVELGGELRGRGAGPQGTGWPAGIVWPGPGPQKVGWRIRLDDAALATSGDYRRYLSWQGRRLGHVLDPRSGSPAKHGLVSVSVLCETAMSADAWATALLVLGPDDGWRLARREGLAAHFVVDEKGHLVTRATPELQAQLLGPPSVAP